jgi:hypothetical protein
VCFGICPVYTINILEDGTVVCTGIANANKVGAHVFQTSLSAATNTSIRCADQLKHIVRYDGDPYAPIGIVRIEAVAYECQFICSFYVAPSSIAPSAYSASICA